MGIMSKLFGTPEERKKKELEDLKEKLEDLKEKLEALEEKDDIIVPIKEEQGKNTMGIFMSPENRDNISMSELWRYNTPRGFDFVNEVSMSGSGNYVAASTNESIYLLSGGNLLWKHEVENFIWGLAISNSGDYIVAAHEKAISLFSKEGEILWKCDIEAVGVDISESGDYVCALSKDERIYLFDKNGKILWDNKVHEPISKISNNIAISSSGEYIISGFEDGNIYLFNKKGSLLWNHKIGSKSFFGWNGMVFGVDISSQGDYIVVGCADKNTYLLNKKGELIWKFGAETKVRRVAISDSSDYIITICEMEQKMGESIKPTYLIDKKGRVLWRCTTNRTACDVAISRSGDYIVLGSVDHNVYFLENPYLFLQKAYKTKIEKLENELEDAVLSSSDLR